MLSVGIFVQKQGLGMFSERNNNICLIQIKIGPVQCR